MTKSIFFFGAFFLMLIQTGCKKDMQELTPTVTADANHGSGTHTVTTNPTFSATAIVSTCLTYNIKFEGEVEFKTNRMYDKDGNPSHFTRVWSIKGLTASAVTASGGTFTSTQHPAGINYDVIAGAEMFNIKGAHLTTVPATIAASDVFIHQGTVVLQNVNDPSDKLVIRHEIVKTGSGEMARMGWYINGQFCGN